MPDISSRKRIKRRIIERIEARSARISVVGLGYVGLPLAVSFAEAGFAVVGIDTDQEKVEGLRQNVSHVPDVPSERLHKLPAEKLEFHSAHERVVECDAVIICVPTPLGKTRDPDLSYLIRASDAVSEFLQAGMLVILESTTYPGTTEELVQPILESSGLRAGSDFFLAFSPERIDPGRSDFILTNTPKVVGGVTLDCLEVAVMLYRQIVNRVVKVSSTQAAEMVKLLENTFRAVNIALVNEIAIMCDKLDLDVWEVVGAAATKPYGFMPFSPGPGVGGHCIPLDPHYLSWKLKTLNYNARFIQLAGEINSQMPEYWTAKIQDALNDQGQSVKGSRILLLGVAYKKDVDDVRESPALDMIELLRQKKADLAYFDPYVPSLHFEGFALQCESDLVTALKRADCTVVVTDHTSFDWEEVRRCSRLIVDTRHVNELSGGRDG